MTQYEIGELDLTAQVSAAQSATNYIHADSSGIRIASANPATQNQRLELTNNNAIFYDKDGKKRTQVDNNGLHIFDASSTPVEVALFGSTVGTTGTTAFARIGKSDSSRFEISPTTLSAYSGNTQYFSVSANGITFGTDKTVATTAQLDEKADASDSIEYIVGTQTAATNAWTGITKETSLVAGKQISYYLPKAGNSSPATLNLTLNNGNGDTTGAKAIKMVYSTSSNTGSLSNVTTHYPVGSIINMTYDGTQWVISNYNTNTDTVANRYASSVIAGLNGIKRYTLCMKDSAGNWTSIVNQDNNTTISGKTCYTGGLQLGKVMYHATNGNYAAGANSGEIWESRNTFDFRYSANGIALNNTSTLQLRKFVYLVGTIGNDGLFYLDTTNWWTQTPNDTTKTYVLIGAAHSANHSNGGAYQVNLSDSNPTFKYDGLELVEQIISNYMSFDSTNGLKIASSNPSSATTYVQITNSSIGMCKDSIEYIKLWENNNTPTVRIGHEISGHADITPNGMEIFDSDDSLASFGEVIRIGKEYINNSDYNKNYMELDSNSIKLIDKNNTCYFEVCDLRNTNGGAIIEESFIIGKNASYNSSTSQVIIDLEFVPNLIENPTVTIEGTDVDGGGVVTGYIKRIYAITSSAPQTGAKVSVSYFTIDPTAKAFTFGMRQNQSHKGAMSFSEGYSNTASGQYSHAEGYSTIANNSYTHTEGYNTLANGSSSHAEGYNTLANRDSSHAEGEDTVANNYYSHAEGFFTIANGQSSHAEGFATKANGSDSHAEGYNTKANGYASHTEGENTLANGRSSHAEGYNTIASGYTCHAEGWNTIADGQHSHAEGYFTIADGQASHAEGENTAANGDYSHAEGYNTKIDGISSHAEGWNTKASGNYSHVEGYCTKAGGQYQHVSGKYNIEDLSDTYAVIIGNGTADDARSNALTVDWNGNAYLAGNVKNMNGTNLYANASHTHSYLPLSGGTVTGTLTLSKTTDLSGTANNSPALIIGGTATQAHMEFDANEIQAKTNGTSVASLILNNDGGNVTIGASTSTVNLRGTVQINGKGLSPKTVSGESSSTSIAGGSGANFTVTVTPTTGYAVSGLQSITANETGLSIASFSNSGNTWTVGIRNHNSSSKTVKVTVKVFCIPVS